MSVEVCFRYMPRQQMKALNKAGIESAKNADAGWSKAFELLRYELAKIKATDVVVEAGYKPDQVRADGWPYSAARPEHHQVRISFKRGEIAMSFSQGGFSAIEYNVWLIARTLSSLRAVDRYGCTQGGEQYRGWAQLPAGNAIQVGEFASIEDAAGYIRRVADGRWRGTTDRNILDNLREAYRDAARSAHPDGGGNAETMGKVNRAKDFIEKYRGSAA